MSGRLLVAYDNYSVYTQNVVEYLDSFARHSDWEVRYAHVTLGAKLGFSLSEFDAIFHSHSVWLHQDDYIGADYLEQLPAFPGIKIAFLQDEGERTNRYRAAIRDLGFHVVLTCVRSQMLERVYPREFFPDTEFIPVLPAYVPDHLAARGMTERPLRERTVKIGYRATDIGARFGKLAFKKFEIGRRMREICEARGIPHDIELTTPQRIFEKRIYGTAWYDFVASCQTNLGSEGCSNVYDFDGAIEALYEKLSAERGCPPSYEEFSAYTDRLDAEFDMAQITPRILEAAALRTALILFPGRYSGLIEPDEHYVELAEDFSNVDAVLARLDDPDGLQAMADRAYQRIVASGEYSYRHFVQLVEQAMLRKSRELGIRLRPPRQVSRALDLWTDLPALASRRELPTSAPRHFVFFQYKQLFQRNALDIAELHQAYGAQIAQLNEANGAQIAQLNEAYGTQIAELTEAHNAELEHIAQLNGAYGAQIAQLNEAYGTQIAELTEAHNAELEHRSEADNAELGRLHAAYGGEIARLNAALAETRVWGQAKRAVGLLKLLATDRLGRAVLIETVRTGPSGRGLLVQAARLLAARRGEGGVIQLVPLGSVSRLVLHAIPTARPTYLSDEAVSLAEIAAMLRDQRVESLALVIGATISGRSHLIARDRYELPDLLAWLSRRSARLALLGLAERAPATAGPNPLFKDAAESTAQFHKPDDRLGDWTKPPPTSSVANRDTGFGADEGIRGPRVLMLCDDLQIDRRIILEAKTLIGRGCDVIVLGRAGPGHPNHAIDGGVKIERIDYSERAAHRQAREAVRNVFAEMRASGSDVRSQAKSAAKRMRLQLPNFGPPWLERWIARQRRPLRGAARALLWPPYRLDVLRYLAPSLSLPMQFAVYLPSLILTPRPAALRWHWQRVRDRWMARRRALREQPRFVAGTATPPEIQAAPGPEDLNDWELALIERGLFFRPDIVHAHDLPQLRAAWTAGRMLNIPCIYDAHEMYPEIGTLSPEDQRKCREVESRFIRQVDRVITVNPFIAQQQAVTYRIKKPTVILNAAELPPGFAYGTRTDKLRSALGLSSEHKILLFQGWVSLDRSLGELVKAIREVPEEIHLAILGYGEDIVKLLGIAEASHVAGRVHVLKPVPQDELIYWVASADAGIIPYQARDENYRYCSPNKLFEFIAACTPIIANDLPYLRRVVAGEGYGVVAPFDGSDGYARAVRSMFDSARGGPDRFRPALLATGERYLWAQQAPTLLKIYRSLENWPKGQQLQKPPNAHLSWAL
jgi:glycosyltransferase involved in cell wall biosynthesis